VSWLLGGTVPNTLGDKLCHLLVACEVDYWRLKLRGREVFIMEEVPQCMQFNCCRKSQFSTELVPCWGFLSFCSYSE